ncbi:toxin-antitoxin system YwqK family antitoxin [Dokdonia sp. Asnod1-B02]|uniref:toxin-antitoxin system YwqK family antitoxin n=1 Tax=Dokdonia sp. Asnod1-B02 TaxID=3160573 RepID=UPI00386BA9C9
MFIRSFIIILSILLISCNDNSLQEMDIAIHSVKPKTISDIEVLKKELVLNPLEGAWYYNNELFSGYSLRFYPNDTLAEKIGYIQGKREGIAQKWSENGTLRIESYYKNNRLDSIYKSWWENGVLASQSNYTKGVKEGVEREWYATGVLAKQRNLDNGQESGLQKAWLENGTLYVNYEARNGRIFGMRKANSCYKLEDEIIITK